MGTANLVVWAQVGVRDRAALLGARLLLAEGSIQRASQHAEVPIAYIICKRLLDRTDLLNSLRQGSRDFTEAERCREAPVRLVPDP